jgi:hypothetical protein
VTATDPWDARERATAEAGCPNPAIAMWAFASRSPSATGTPLALPWSVLALEDILGLGPIRTREQQWVAFRAAEGMLFVSGRPPHWWWRKEVRRMTSQGYCFARRDPGAEAQVIPPPG